MVPKCPINSIGIRNPIMCSDGYMYEEKCLVEWLSENSTSPINRKFIDFVNVCEISERCLNEYCDEIEDSYERINFTYSKEELIIKYYINMYEHDEEVGIIFDKDLMLKLIDRNCSIFEFASDELKDDKEVVLQVIKHNGVYIEYASDRIKDDKEKVLKAVENNGYSIAYVSEKLRFDESVVLAAVKTNPRIIINIYDKILVNDLIYETACIYNTRNFVNEFLSKNNLSSEYNKDIITLTCYDSINKVIEELNNK